MTGASATTTAMVEREMTCSACGRFLSACRASEDVRPGMVKYRVYCRVCKAWRWYDAATGLAREG